MMNGGYTWKIFPTSMIVDFMAKRCRFSNRPGLKDWLGVLFPPARYLLILLTLLHFASACSSPAVSFDQTAASYNLMRTVVTGTKFQHVVFWQRSEASRTLRVYLGGDGMPMSTGQPAQDPTPRNPLMLRLLALDPGPAIYVGRPCYHGLANTLECTHKIWTSGRYSKAVVESLASAIREVVTSGGYERIDLFGYSGGGALAMLLAERLPEIRLVVTLAANLDVEAWARHHEISGMTASLNPAKRSPLREEILQRHYAGGRDKVVPVRFTVQGVQRPNAELIVVDDFTHVCCWEKLWPKILAEVVSLP